jgi:CRP-like cAMP-binding protein
MDNPQINIAEQITRGFISIDSLEEFEKFIKRSPNDPALQRAYADLLVKKNMADKAALSYGKAAALFLKSGNLLAAVVSKLLQWRIKSPAYQETQLFLSALCEDRFPDTALKIFVGKLSKPEVLAVIKCMKNIHMPAEKLIKRGGDAQDDLYFIVSGNIKETSYKPVKTKEETVFKQSIVNLSAGDWFGNLYPIKEEKQCQSYIETITSAELVKLSKQMLIQVLYKYPNVESGLQAISEFRLESQKEALLKKNRKGQRHALTRKMTLEIFPHSSANFPIILEAYSKDISVGGTCVVLDSKDISVAKSVASFSKTIKDSKVKISFPIEGLELKVSGKIAWTQEVIFNGEKTLALGIQFQDLSPKLSGMLFIFADSSKNK